MSRVLALTHPFREHFTSARSAASLHLPPPPPRPQLFIDNKFVDSLDGATFATLNPATGEPIVSVSEAKAADVDAAVAAAKRAFARGAPWRTMDASERGRLRECAATAREARRATRKRAPARPASPRHPSPARRPPPLPSAQ